MSIEKYIQDNTCGIKMDFSLLFVYRVAHVCTIQPSNNKSEGWQYDGYLNVNSKNKYLSPVHQYEAIYKSLLGLQLELKHKTNLHLQLEVHGVELGSDLEF